MELADALACLPLAETCRPTGSVGQNCRRALSTTNSDLLITACFQIATGNCVAFVSPFRNDSREKERKRGNKKLTSPSSSLSRSRFCSSFHEGGSISFSASAGNGATYSWLRAGKMSSYYRACSIQARGTGRGSKPQQIVP